MCRLYLTPASRIWLGRSKYLRYRALPSSDATNIPKTLCGVLKILLITLTFFFFSSFSLAFVVVFFC